LLGLKVLMQLAYLALDSQRQGEICAHRKTTHGVEPQGAWMAARMPIFFAQLVRSECDDHHSLTDQVLAQLARQLLLAERVFPQAHRGTSGKDHVGTQHNESVQDQECEHCSQHSQVYHNAIQCMPLQLPPAGDADHFLNK
jgi:hypothetical protein